MREAVQRSAKWARPGGGHDRLIRTLTWALPTAVGVLAAFLVTAPLTMKRELGFTLQRGEIERVPERLRATNATYRGLDDEGQPFTLAGTSAVQSAAATQMVALEGMMGEMTTGDGKARLDAPNATFHPDERTVAVNGPLTVAMGDGYALKTSDVDVDLGTRRAASRGRVSGSIPLGTFTADQVVVDLDERHVALAGRARLHVKQGALR